MAEVHLKLDCIALADQIETALIDDEFTIEEQREVLIDDLWNSIDQRNGSRINKLYKSDGTSIDRPVYVRLRPRNRS